MGVGELAQVERSNQWSEGGTQQNDVWFHWVLFPKAPQQASNSPSVYWPSQASMGAGQWAQAPTRQCSDEAKIAMLPDRFEHSQIYFFMFGACNKQLRSKHCVPFMCLAKMIITGVSFQKANDVKRMVREKRSCFTRLQYVRLDGLWKISGNTKIGLAHL